MGGNKKKARQIGGMSVHSMSVISSAIMQELASNHDFIQSIVDKINGVMYKLKTFHCNNCKYDW